MCLFDGIKSGVRDQIFHLRIHIFLLVLIDSSIFEFTII